MRMGLTCFPFVSLGCWIFGHDAPMAVCMLDVGDVVDEDSCDNLEKLDDSLNNNKVFNKLKPVYFVVPLGCMVWQPYGYVTMITGKGDFTKFCVLVHPSKTLFHLTPPDCQEVMSKSLKKFGRKNAAREPWRTCNALLEKCTKRSR